MAEHTGPNQFEVLDLTIHVRGTIAYFFRKLEEAVTRLKSFFFRVNHDYVRFNYLGEWHSHPRMSSAWPSSTDLSQLAWLDSELASEGLPGLMAIAADDGVFAFVMPRPRSRTS